MRHHVLFENVTSQRAWWYEHGAWHKRRDGSMDRVCLWCVCNDRFLEYGFHETFSLKLRSRLNKRKNVLWLCLLLELQSLPYFTEHRDIYIESKFSRPSGSRMPTWCLRIQLWGQHLGPRKKNEQGSEHNYTTRAFVTSLQLLFTAASASFKHLRLA